MRRSFLATLSILAAIASTAAHAATLNVSGGQLLGASGVEVDGDFYDVEFVEGTCIALFSGCDEASDFTFQSNLDALAAVTALGAQVVLDGGLGAFDTDPVLTNGCTAGGGCSLATPYATASSDVMVAYYRNEFGAGGSTNTRDLATNFDTSGASAYVYARWTPVPEPGTAVLIAIGLAAMGSRRCGST